MTLVVRGNETLVVKSRQLFKRLGWPVSEKAPFNIRISFGEGTPPFDTRLGYASLHLRSKKDEPDWSIWVTSPGGGGTEIWDDAVLSNSLGLPSLVDLTLFPEWLRGVRPRCGGSLATALIDAGRSAKAEPSIERWLSWETTVFASTRRAAIERMSLLEWVSAPREFPGLQELAAAKRRVSRQLETDTSGLSAAELRAVADRVVDQQDEFLPVALGCRLPGPMRVALAESLVDPSRFHASHLQARFLSVALETATLEDVAAYDKAVRGFGLRLSSMVERRARLPVTPALVSAARTACLGFELPRYLPSCENRDASVFLLLAIDGTDASAEALGRVLGLLGAAAAAGRSDASSHRSAALSIARTVGSAGFRRLAQE